MIGSIDAPDDGTYDVAARGAPDAGSRGPEITFGDSPFDEVGDRVENVVGVVIGPIGLGVVGLLAALGIVRWVRRRSTVEAPTLPSDGPGG